MIATCIMVYLEIGGLIWLVLSQIGVIGTVFQNTRSRGYAMDFFWAARSTLAAIIVWPLFVVITIQRRKEVWGAFKRMVWR